MADMRIALAIVALLALAAPERAAADIGVLGSDGRRVQVGERVTVRIGCGGCPRSGLALPVALVPAGHTGRHPCRGTSCASASVGPPTGPPYVPVGVARPGRVSDVSRLQFDVPKARRGLYAYVVYCAPCLPGPRGSLIGHPSARYPSANAPRHGDYRGFIRIKPPS